MAEYEEIGENNDQNEDTITKIGGMYEGWFLDYASYVILKEPFQVSMTASNLFSAGSCSR